MIRTIAVSATFTVAAIGLTGCGGSSTPTAAPTATTSATHAAAAPTTTPSMHTKPVVSPTSTVKPKPKITPTSKPAPTSAPSPTTMAPQSAIAMPPVVSKITWDGSIARDANGFALGGPAPAQQPGAHPSRQDCLTYLAEDRAWSNYQNEHRPVGSTNALPFSADVQYLYTVCHLNYYGSS
ncbi:hypothetical protein [Leekyejoonella antrihumi]|uniref:Uncharacterized protein n=1 Tax=Leekyejoonella antrihumi TaxID=1660198 RepID=A0A563DS63_9MICO|nr:hypothetical protein [Leekyejoonella antrihumi]TWP33009.1 hypothetical protein FGL98_22705 [Leekyejoonella antrihumi]